MTLKQDLQNKITSYVNEKFEILDTTIIPDSENNNLTFGNKGLKNEFAFLFVDIRKSSSLHETYGYTKAARIYKSFHDINVRIIESNEGEVRSFDGDRTMGVFSGKTKNSNAVKAAMQIQYSIRKILNPILGTNITCGFGIDSGEILVIKVGKGRNKNNNDLVWLGKADNYASHLANEANNKIIISSNVYDKLNNTSKFYQNADMWYSKKVNLKNGKIINCYESNYDWIIN